MRIITHFLNVVLWVLLGLIVFQNYTGIHIGVLANFNLRLITDFFALGTLALDLLVYTGVLGPKNSTLTTISAVFLIWIAVIVLLRYALKVSGLGWLFLSWDVFSFGVGVPILTLRGRKK